MRVLAIELRQIFQKNPKGILAVLGLDILEVAFLSSNPLVIGLCIDSFFEQNYLWLCVLIMLQVAFILVRVTNKVLDTRVYEKIIEDKSNTYYEKALHTNTSNSKITSRLDLVIQVSSFFDGCLVQLIDIAVGTLFSLGYLFCMTEWPLFLTVLLTSILVLVCTQRFRKQIYLNNKQLQDIDEEKADVISSRKKVRYRMFASRNRDLRVRHSDLDAKSNLIIDVIQAGLLIFAIVYLFHAGSYSSGQVFSIVTYVIMLNENVCSFNEIMIEIADLIDSTIRLNSETDEVS